MTESFLSELRWRGALHQTTAQEALDKHLEQPGRVAYCGFDPTKNSLTIGNLIQVTTLRRWQRAGHKPVILMGGGTGMIGDPSGKDSERTLMTRDEIRANVDAQRAIMEKLIDLDPKSANAGTIVDNADWLAPLAFIDVLRDVGKHFSVNAMIQRDSVRERLHHREQGISYTEFSYMLLQAYDFLHLKRSLGCTVQVAGSDQYGNIVAGIDLIHRTLGSDSEAYGVTTPLLKRADGKKLGKTEQGAIWLSADRTSPYAFYQYFINTDDADVGVMLKWFSMKGEAELSELLDAHAREPGARRAQRELAREVTRNVHGESELTKVEAASEALFSGEVQGLSRELLHDVFADVPHTEHAKEQLSGEGVALIELLPITTLASSKREARQFLEAGAVSVNGARAALDQRLTASDLLHDQTILLKRGKKLWHATRWE
ncbi:MAG TPA: tyrosine--tRNA ligase [Polyangiales bacterium]|nr:tyrosine--tRNA ligase [Polyangiales bacterium]